MRLPSPTRVVRLIAEETTLFASLVKWTGLATGVGMLAGGATALFLGGLDWATAAMERAPARLLWLPPGFLAAHLLVRFLAPEAEGHGTDKVIEAVHRRWGRIPVLVAPVKLLATVLTIATGGSVGKEGPAAQIGASLASGLASLLRLGPSDRRKIVICGIGAGFAAVFGTPIAGAVFGLEVLVLGTLMYDVLYPSFVAGIVGYQVATRLGVRHFHQALYELPRPTEGIFLKTIAAGIVFGLVAVLLIEALGLAHRAARRLPLPGWALAAGGGSLLAGLAWLASPRYLGLGIPTLEASIRGAWVPAEAWLLKIVFTAISLGAGGSGGIVTPIFFIGATAGSALGDLLGFDRGTFAAIGMVSLLAGATNAPLAAAIMAIELFGPAVAPFAAISCIVSFVMVGHRSVYPSQRLGIAKTRSVRVRRGAELGEMPEVAVRPTGLRRLRAIAAALRRLHPRA
jgi:H+/Cl- antiporter ClcA